MDKEDIKEGTGDMFNVRDCYWLPEYVQGYERPSWRPGELQSWVPGDPLIVGKEILGVVEDAETGDLQIVPVPRIRFRPKRVEHTGGVDLEGLVWALVVGEPVAISVLRDQPALADEDIIGLVNSSSRLELNPEMNCFVQRIRD